MKAYILEAVKKGVVAAKQNLWPGVILQVIALGLIVSYYNLEVVKQSLDKIGGLSKEWSPWFPMVTTTIFGGVIPLIIGGIQARRANKPPKTWAYIGFTLMMWAFNGYMSDWFYGFQAKLFGEELSVLTIALKVMVDQFLWVPLYFVPIFTIAFLWRDCNFSLKSLRDALKEKNLVQRGLPLMISNWAVWIPAASIIYSFPLQLQLILMNLILVFWSLILTLIVE